MGYSAGDITQGICVLAKTAQKYILGARLGHIPTSPVQERGVAEARYHNFEGIHQCIGLSECGAAWHGISQRCNPRYERLFDRACWVSRLTGRLGGDPLMIEDVAVRKSS